MVQKNSAARPVRSRHEVVVFEDFGVPEVDIDLLIKDIKPQHRPAIRKVQPQIGSSKYKGVSISNGTHKGNKYTYWRALIKVDGKYHQVGNFPYTYDGEKDAARAFDNAAIRIRGKDTPTNQQYYGDL